MKVMKEEKKITSTFDNDPLLFDFDGAPCSSICLNIDALQAEMDHSLLVFALCRTLSSRIGTQMRL